MWSKILYRLFDPRPTDEAKAANEAIFALGPVLGIEVTVPALAARCELGNIDPQHSGGNAELAAIEAAYQFKLPDPLPETVVMATVRADLDALGAMVVMADRLEGNERYLSIAAIAEDDKFAHGGWPGKYELPSSSNPWPRGIRADQKELAAIESAVFDFKVPLDTRVEWVKAWLVNGEEPTGYREKVEKERQALIAALESGAVKISETYSEKVVVVITNHFAATMIGYAHAPVVVALNPEFKFQGGEPHRKFTVCQFTGDYVDLVAVKTELAALEAGWGGSPTIVGSPQGVASVLSVQQVAEVVIKHLKN